VKKLDILPRGAPTGPPHMHFGKKRSVTPQLVDTKGERFDGTEYLASASESEIVGGKMALAMEPTSATLKTPGIEQPSLFGQMEAPSCFDAGKMRRKPWAWLLRHVFAIDVTECPECSGKMRWRAVALRPEAIAEGLARAGFFVRGPPRTENRSLRAGSESPRSVEGHG
jgi:hypothetical protein